MMQPQTREAVGWLIYDCERYIILTWDRDADPPTLHGGDPKASGLVLAKKRYFGAAEAQNLPATITKKFKLVFKSQTAYTRG